MRGDRGVIVGYGAVPPRNHFSLWRCIEYWPAIPIRNRETPHYGSAATEQMGTNTQVKLNRGLFKKDKVNFVM